MDMGALAFNSLNPKIKIEFSFVAPIHFLQKLIKYQANSLSCVIMSVILMTSLFYKALILQGEI